MRMGGEIEDDQNLKYLVVLEFKHSEILEHYLTSSRPLGHHRY